MSFAERSAIQFMGCRFDAVRAGEALDLVFQWSGNAKRTCHTIVTVNVSILMMMRSHRQLASAIEKADLVVADGVPIVWASRWLLSKGLPERVTGVDLMEKILHRAAIQGVRLFLLGTTEVRLRTLQAKLLSTYPGLRIVGAHNGYFAASDSNSLINEIRDSEADVLLIGMPAPRKEIWSQAYRDALDIPVVLGVGGAFDVIAGFVPRAPRVVQRLGLEWGWRLILEPRKLWRRYLVSNSQFLALLMKELLFKVSFPLRGTAQGG